MSAQDITENAIILALESSGNAASAALLQKGKITAFSDHQARHGHAETLIGLVNEVIEFSGIDFEAITHIAAGCGPGSFTGLRVCLSAAKGFQLATDARPLGINGLSALSYQAMGVFGPSSQSDYLSLVDTRRGSFFAQFSDEYAKASGPIYDAEVPEICALIKAYFAENPTKKLILTCAEDELVSALNEQLSSQNLQQITWSSHQLDASDIALYALACLKNPECVVDADFEPLYVVQPKLGPSLSKSVSR